MPRATYDDGYQDAMAEKDGGDILDSDVIEVVTSTLHGLRMGYDTPTLREVLEEMERIMNNG